MTERQHHAEDSPEAGLPPPHIIDTPEDAATLQNALQGAARVAVDTESNSLYAYRARVCLIQMSTDSEDFLIDPLRIELNATLPFLGDLFASPDIEKVFHAAEYDVMILNQDFGFTFRSIFDTMDAARVLGWEQVGLASILEDRYGVTINKRHQRADWGKRPLAPELVHYARMDTHYLLMLRDELFELLAAGGHLEEAGEMFEEVCQARWEGDTFDPEGYWRLNGARDLPPRNLAVLRELYLFREQQAQSRDLPLFKVISDKTLLDLAIHAPQTAGAVQRVPGMTDIQARRYGQGLLEAVWRGLKARPPQRPHSNGRPGEDVLRRFEALSSWRKERGLKRGVSSDVVISKEALWELARKAPRSLEDLQAIRTIGPWRIRTYGQEILRVLAEADQ